MTRRRTVVTGRAFADDAGTGRAFADDAGTAIVEFVMVSVLLVLLLFGVMQIGAVFYVGNVVAASAADGARYAAGADVGVGEGGRRAEGLIRRGLSGSAGRDIRCTASVVADDASGLQLTRVECRGRIRSIVLPVGRFVEIDVVARAVKEQP